MDKEIKDFFKEIRKSDQDVEVPDFELIFPKKNRFKRNYFLYAGVAASFLIVFSLYLFNQRKTVEITDTHFVTIFTDNEEASTKSLIIEESSVYSWEAPSESLLNNFNE